MVDLNHKVMRILGGADERIPGDWLSLKFGEPDPDYGGQPMLVAATGNDGFELLLGYPDRWRFGMRHNDARKLAWWILWDWWIVATWCGLRRTLFYWAVRRVVAAHERRMKERRRSTS